MKSNFLLIFFCLFSLSMMGQNVVTRQKQQTQKHTVPKTPTKPKTPAKPAAKTCDICEKPLSKCEYGGAHPKCAVCGKLAEYCEYKGEHPKCADCGKLTTECEYRGNHPKCNICGKVMTLCEYKGKHGNYKNHEWVDMGLPSGTKWATCNIGASSPEEYGDYFAWGETKTKYSYSKDNYFDKLYTNYSPNRSTVLSSSNDAAHVNWGQGWKMPTMDQVKELILYTTYKLTTLNGINGMLITSKKNGNTLFFPAAGFYDGNENTRTESIGYYLTRSLHHSSCRHTDAANIICVLGFYDKFNTDNTYRYQGNSVRPVYEY